MLMRLKIIIFYFVHHLSVVLHPVNAEDQLVLAILLPVLEEALGVGVLKLVPAAATVHSEKKETILHCK